MQQVQASCKTISEVFVTGFDMVTCCFEWGQALSSAQSWLQLVGHWPQGVYGSAMMSTFRVKVLVAIYMRIPSVACCVLLFVC